MNYTKKYGKKIFQILNQNINLPSDFSYYSRYKKVRQIIGKPLR